MAVNLDKPHLWKRDIRESVDFYNDWFMRFAPQAFRETRERTAHRVETALKATAFLTDISPNLLKEHPSVLPILRMSTCPPIARDRLIGLADVSKNLVENMEDESLPRIPPKMLKESVLFQLEKIGNIIEKMADRDIFTWLDRGVHPTEKEVARASTIVADRLCGALSNPIIRNAQERRQLKKIGEWLDSKGYKQLLTARGVKFNEMQPGTFSFRMNVSVQTINDQGEEGLTNIPVDVVIMPQSAQPGDLPLLMEAKSAGDFTNVNKRRKEEAQKMHQLQKTYGDAVRFGLFLCGYFNAGYLGYEAHEGIDWVWEHRIEDLTLFGI